MVNPKCFASNCQSTIGVAFKGGGCPAHRHLEGPDIIAKRQKRREKQRLPAEQRRYVDRFKQVEECATADPSYPLLKANGFRGTSIGAKIQLNGSVRVSAATTLVWTFTKASGYASWMPYRSNHSVSEDFLQDPPQARSLLRLEH